MHEFIHIVYVVCTLFAITVVQGGPKKLGYRLMTIILSNLQKKIHWKIPW